MFRFCRKIGSVHKKVTNHKGEDKIWLIRDDNGFYLIRSLSMYPVSVATCLNTYFQEKIPFYPLLSRSLTILYFKQL